MTVTVIIVFVETIIQKGINHKSQEIFAALLIKIKAKNAGDKKCPLNDLRAIFLLFKWRWRVVFLMIPNRPAGEITQYLPISEAY